MYLPETTCRGKRASTYVGAWLNLLSIKLLFALAEVLQDSDEAYELDQAYVGEDQEDVRLTGGQRKHLQRNAGDQIQRETSRRLQIVLVDFLEIRHHVPKRIHVAAVELDVELENCKKLWIIVNAKTNMI